MKVGKGEVGLEAEERTYQVEETQVLRNRHMRNLSLEGTTGFVYFERIKGWRL